MSPLSKKLPFLGLLYVAEGLPFGFQATALPILLRQEKVSLTAIGFLSALSLPWLLKALWAPLVDRFGTRKAWIIPMQLGIAASAAGASVLGVEALGPLLAAVFLMNLFAATMDIAVDGLAVDWLESHELGVGNAVQVVGYKFGMLSGGGLLVWASAWMSWSALLRTMSICLILVAVAASFLREPPRSTTERQDFAEIFGTAKRALLTPASLGLIVVIATYKSGESMIDAMWKPFLVDGGIAASDIGLWVGTYGMVASLLGSTLGGVVASRASPLAALTVFGALRIIPMLGQLLLTYSGLSASGVIAVGCAEHFFGGAMTSVMFALMMSRVDARIGATHYTVLASIEVIGKLPSGPVSGVLSQHLGFRSVVLLGIALSFVFLAILRLSAKRWSEVR